MKYGSRLPGALACLLLGSLAACASVRNAALAPAPRVTPPSATERFSASRSQDGTDQEGSAAQEDPSIGTDMRTGVLPAPTPPPPPQEDEKYPIEMDGNRHQHFLVMFGQRTLEDDDWSESRLDEQPTIGFSYDRQISKKYGLSSDFGIYGSSDSSDIPVAGGDQHVNSTTVEADFGVLMMWRPGVLRPYVGAGLALVWSNARVAQGPTLFDGSDFSPAGYARAGLAYEHESGSMVGLDVHYLGGTDMDFGGLDTDVDGYVVSLVLGYGF